ncbi:MAG: esterase/lipase family protein [Alphaproteobacteria bacterium]
MRLTQQQLAAWRKAKARLLLPIVYVRGFAMTGGEIEDTSADPFNGFNIGSMLLRTAWTGDSARHVFESPVLRLSQPPYGYRLAFSDGVRGLDVDQKQELRDRTEALQGQGNDGNMSESPFGIVAIYRYYDAASRAFGDGTRPGMETYGWGLGRLVVDLLEATGAPGVYLVAHSMGGLVARTFLQNEAVLDDTHPEAAVPAHASPEAKARAASLAAVKALIEREPRPLRISQEQWLNARRSVRRLFTYGTPHNGITVQGGIGNTLLGPVDSLLGLELSNFERERMREYLGKPPEANSLGNTFDIQNVFCIVGTGASDYPVAAGFSRRLVGQLSDGLVELDNAVLHGPAAADNTGSADAAESTVLAARAYMRRAHSGPYGMVNSEEGFGNLSRFLFGDARIDGDLLVRRIDLPPQLEEIKDTQNVRASYTFETALRVRGERWVMTERLAPDGSAIFRRYDELFPEKDHTRLATVENRTETDEMMQARRQRHRRVELFSAFLDTGLRTLDDAPERIRDRELKGTLGFALRLRVSVPDYEVDGSLLFWRRHHYEGSALFDRDLVFLAFPDPAVPGGWGLAWGDNAADPTNDRLRIITAATEAEPQDVPDAGASGADGYRRNLPSSVEFWIPLREDGPPAFRAWLRLTARVWNAPVP